MGRRQRAEGGRKHKNQTMKQYEAVIETLKRLGGIATLGQLNQEVFKIKDCKWGTKTPFASIRRIVQERSEIYRVRPGLWALTSLRKQLEANGIIEEGNHNADSSIVKDFNHSYYQGLLLYVGNMNGFRTYAPGQDKNKKCVNVRLQDICSLNAMPPFSYPEIVHRSSTIDVIWFSGNSLGTDLYMPRSFFEVEHSTDIQNSLLKYNDLQDFNADMYIVADKRRVEDFERKLRFSAFDSLRKKRRVKFLDYERLVDIYEATTKISKLNIKL